MVESRETVNQKFMKPRNAFERELARVRWYKQGSAGKPFYLSYPLKTCMRFTRHGRATGLNFHPLVISLNNDFFDIYFSRLRMESVAASYMKKEHASPGSMRAFYGRWKRSFVQPFLAELHSLERANLRTLSTSDLLLRFYDFSSVYTALWGEAIFLDAFDVASDRILDRSIQNERSPISSEQLHQLMAPSKRSWMKQEERELHAIGALMGKGSVDREMRKRLERHAKKWHWISNDYATFPRLNWRFFARRVTALMRDGFDVSSLRPRRGGGSRLAISSELKKTVSFLGCLSEWRDDRKAYFQMATGCLYRFAKEFARRSGVSLTTVEYSWWWEVPEFFARPKRVENLASKRTLGLVSFDDPERDGEEFTGATARRLTAFMASLEETSGGLRGRPAFAGVVRGTVRVIRSQLEFKKMRRGDILVAPNTRPEYLPIMKIAGALVSEEGGITCHTAIVARELKIPAIVGVQGAIAVLKDGDRVEVDANTGNIRKIP